MIRDASKCFSGRFRDGGVKKLVLTPAPLAPPFTLSLLPSPSPSSLQQFHGTPLHLCYSVALVREQPSHREQHGPYHLTKLQPHKLHGPLLRHSLSLSLSVCVSVTVSHSLSLSLCLCLCPSLTLSLFVCVYVSLSFCLSHYLSVCLYITVSLSLSVCLSITLLSEICDGCENIQVKNICM